MAKVEIGSGTSIGQRDLTLLAGERMREEHEENLRRQHARSAIRKATDVETALKNGELIVVGYINGAQQLETRNYQALRQRSAVEIIRQYQADRTSITNTLNNND
jgi:beta-lactam-binding protein with PASTA domain